MSARFNPPVTIVWVGGDDRLISNLVLFRSLVSLARREPSSIYRDGDVRRHQHTVVPIRVSVTQNEEREIKVDPRPAGSPPRPARLLGLLAS